MAAIATGPFVAACVVLAVAGLSKLRDPVPTVAAMRAVGLPGSPATVRLLGGFEVCSAVLGLVVGGPFAALVGSAYVALAVVALRLVRRAPRTPCGCLGTSRAPASVGHVVVNVAAAVCAFVAAGAPAPIDMLTDQPLAGIPFLVLAGSCARLVALMLDALPDLHLALREGRS